MQAVILAGGEGTRLRPLTTNLPKPMIPLVNRPFLERMIEYLKRHGVTEVILAMGYLPDKIQDHFGDGQGLGVKLTYSVEQTPLGTAGAVKLVEPLLKGTFIVLNGDIVTDMDLSAEIRLHRRRKATATLFLVPVEDPSRFGVVELDAAGRVLRFTEKPPRGEARANTINGGCYILEPEALSYIPPNQRHMFEHGLFPKLVEVGLPMYGYAPRCYWNDVGTPATYLQVHHDILTGVAKEPLPPQATDCTIDSTATLEGPVVLGSGCSIGPKARIEGPTVLGPHCIVGAAATIRQSILWEGVRIGPGSRVQESAIGKGAQLGSGVELTGTVVGDAAVIGDGARLAAGSSVAAGQSIPWEPARA